MTPNKFYYLSSGAKNAMRTLRSVVHVPGVYFRDEYVRNLARDFDEAMTKARAYVGTEATIQGSNFDLNEWGRFAGKPLKSWQKQQIEQIELGLMPFGKHKGAEIESLPESYVKYWVEQEASNSVGQILVQKFTDIANDRDYFSKWENDEKEKEKAREENLEKMEYVGNLGERMVVFLRCDKVLAFDGIYGMTYMNICEDRHGNKFIYKGTKRWEEGVYYQVKATIKAHNEYKGERQNMISRPTVMKKIEKED